MKGIVSEEQHVFFDKTKKDFVLTAMNLVERRYNIQTKNYQEQDIVCS